MTREEAIEFIAQSVKSDVDMAKVADAIKALEQEPYEDAISRQSVLDINENHHGQMPNRINHQIWQEIKDLPSVTPHYTDTEIRSSEDAISREAVLDAIDRYINKSQSTGAQDDFYSFAELVVKQLPSVTPQPKTGHWNRVTDKAGHLMWECDCGWQQWFNTNYCPVCGAKMQEVEE